jgi:septal ring factor EnvC (AmiA/AmiB activator)
MDVADLLKQAEFLNRYDPRDAEQYKYFAERAKPVVAGLYAEIQNRLKEIELQVQCIQGRDATIEQLEIRVKSYPKRIEELQQQLAESARRFDELRATIASARMSIEQAFAMIQR